MENISNAQILQASLSASWENYYQTLSQLSKGYQLPNCLKLLNAADEILNQGKDLTTTTVQERNLIAGVSDNQLTKSLQFDHQLLGDMTSYASFKKVIKADAEGFAKVMKVIPSNGAIDGWHFMQFIDTYQQWFAANGFKQSPLYPATRLLSLKRPDQFVCLNEHSQSKLCDALDIKPLKKQEFQRYWDNIITPIQKAKWFDSFLPMEAAEQPLHRVRFAMLERLLATPLNELELAQIATPAIAHQPQEANKTNAEPVKANLTQSSLIQPVKDTNRKSVHKQPKKLVMEQRQTVKGNLNAATKLMSQYYFANKAKYSSVNLSQFRQEIIERLIQGESVEAVFDSYL